MKKSLIALSVLAAASAVAFADSSVTLYGKLDTGLNVTKAKNDPAKVSMDSGEYYGSRWGIRGVEDLGGGNAVGFQLEQGISSDTGGGNTRQFHRISNLFIRGGWGEIGFGRYGVLSSGTGPYDMIGGVLWLDDATTSFGATNAWNDLSGGALRADNAVTYVSPTFAGFQFRLMYSNRMDGVTEDDLKHTDDNSAKWSESNHYYGVGASYNAGGLGAVLVFDVRDQKGADAIAAVDGGKVKPIYMINFGVNYDFGVITPQFGYAWVNQGDVGSQHSFGLSATAPVAGGKASLGVRYMLGSLKDQYVALNKYSDDKYRTLTVNLLYSYPLSKRTSVYGYAAWTDSSKAWSDEGIVNNPFSGSKVNANGYAIMAGLVHNF